MKSVVATVVLIVLILTGILINKESLAPTVTEEVVEVEIETIATTTNATATSTATSTEEGL